MKHLATLTGSVIHKICTTKVKIHLKIGKLVPQFLNDASPCNFSKCYNPINSFDFLSYVNANFSFEIMIFYKMNLNKDDNIHKSEALKR